MTFYKICETDDLKEGEMKRFEIAGYEYLVVKLQGRFHVLDNFCTHEGGDLSQGTLQGKKVVCPLHAGEFDIGTGKVLAPPPNFPLQVYQVKIEGKDVLVDI